MQEVAVGFQVFPDIFDTLRAQLVNALLERAIVLLQYAKRHLGKQRAVALLTLRERDFVLLAFGDILNDGKNPFPAIFVILDNAGNQAGYE